MPEDIQASFPSVTLPDVYAVIAYYLRHQADIDAYLAQLAGEADRIREEVEARPTTQALREKLIAGKSKR